MHHGEKMVAQFQFVKDKSLTSQTRDSRSQAGSGNAKEKRKDSQPRPEHVLTRNPSNEGSLIFSVQHTIGVQKTTKNRHGSFCLQYLKSF